VRSTCEMKLEELDGRGRISRLPCSLLRSVPNETTAAFRDALLELLLEHDYSTQTGSPNWAAFAERLDGIHYQTLRRAVGGQQRPSPRLIEECARVLGLRPEYFVEYRFYLAQRDFDPREVGRDRALANLKAWFDRSRPGHGVP